MSRRTAFHPTACDALEERAVPSRGTAAGLAIGALGDSYTDEYRFYPPTLSHARNWVEILAATRGVNFGKFTTRSRGEPRDQGFAFDWARYGATSSDMVANQLPGLAAQVAAGEVKYVWIFIGGNDYLYLLRNVLNGSVSLADAPEGLTRVEAQAAANFTTAVHTLLASSPDVRLVVATVPDPAALPIVRLGLTVLPQAQSIVAATSQSISQYNATIQGLAASDPRIALVDLAGQAAVLGGITSGSVGYGGTTIHLTTPGEDYHDFFLADGIHIGTVGQGIIASDFVTAIDSRFDAHVAPLSAGQIVAFARRAQGTPHRASPLP
jgi:hypothetical protein